MKKRVLATCLACAMLLGLATTSALAVNADQFVDVEESDWFYPYVQYVAEKDYMNGVSEDEFAPKVEMSRAMFATVLYRLDDPAKASGESKFVDVPAGTWYTEAVNWAAANEIVNGVGDNKFAPASPITREQMCTMMARFVTYWAEQNKKTIKDKNAEKAFPDAGLISAYAKDAVKQCQMWGLMEGDENGNFNPLKNATRAEVAAVIQRLDELLASSASSGGGSTGGGGGGGGDVSTTETANYTVTATLDVPDEMKAFDLDLLASYTNVTINGSTVTGDKTFGQVSKDLIAGDNATALKSAINEALSRVMGKTTTQTVKDQKVTVSVSDKGVISASISMMVTDLTKTRATQAELEALITKLQNGGSMTFTKAELETMNDLLDKIEQVGGMTDKEIQDKIDQVVAERPELEQIASGMTPEAVQEAAKGYQTQVEGIFTEIDVSKDNIASLPDSYTSKEVTKDPVLMNVAVDLSAYYEKAMEKFNNSKETAIDRLQAELYPDSSKTINRDLAGAMYDLNSPASYVTDNGNGTLTLKSADAYFTMVQENVNKGVAFYESLNENAAFYESLLKRVEEKYKDGYGVSYTGTIADAAALMGDADGIFVDENKDFRAGMTFSIKVTASEDTYDSWLDLISGKWSQAGGILPEDVPVSLAKLLGDYTLTLTIVKK